MKISLAIITKIGIFALILSVGCRADRMELPATGVTEDGKVILSLNVEIPHGQAIATRSTHPTDNEKNIDASRTFVLVLDGTDGFNDNMKLTQMPALASAITLPADNATSGSIKVMLYPETETVYLCILANVSTINKSYLSSLAAGGATLGDIKAALRLPIPLVTGISPNDLPMTAYSDELATITPLTVPSSISNLKLERSVARIDITTAPKANFTLEGATITNAPIRGRMLPDNTFIQPWNGLNVLSYDLFRTSTGEITAQIYVYEKAGVDPLSLSPNPTRLVIYGKNNGETVSTYFPYDIIYNKQGAGGETDTMAIYRNKLYTITISNVGKTGYATLQEAAVAQPYNEDINASVSVTDPYAHDITTNGRQYLATTNANFVIYPEATGPLSNIHIATLSYTSDPLWNQGSIKLQDIDGNPIQNFKLSNENNTLETRRDGSVIYRDLLVDIPGGFTEGYVILHIGNLYKEIIVRRKTPTLAAGMVISDFYYKQGENADEAKFQEFKTAEVSNPTAVGSWLKVSHQEGNAGATSLLDRVTNPNGKVYIHAKDNIGFSGSATNREATVYVGGDADNIRTKIIVRQPPIDVYSGGAQILPFAYVGTFHRWNEMGERLIRIDAHTHFGSLTNVWWQASVVAGEEFIVLDTLSSLSDGGIKVYKGNGVINAYGEGDAPQWQTANEIEANCRLTSTLRTVSGRSGNIFFRVGMTSKLTGPEAQPRYGLIAITYGPENGAATGTHFIYVRQGEAADYLMRPWDSATEPLWASVYAGVAGRVPGTPNTTRGANKFISSNRPLATKFTPYNLTDRTGYKGIVDRGKNGYQFSRFPSQGGYYFGHITTKAASPYSGVNVPNITDNRTTNWNVTWETCPSGYRRPNDAPLNTAVSSLPSVLTTAPNSELRQSLFLYPLNGFQQSEFANQLRGYIADGYFDRRPITESVNLIQSSTGMIPARGIVSISGEEPESAFWGFLVFNPYNYASIFLPLAGQNTSGIGSFTIANYGTYGGFHTTNTYDATRFTAGLHYGTGVSSNGWLGFAFDMYKISANSDYYSVRCVKDENPPILTPNDDGDNNQVDIGDVGAGDTLISIRHIYVNDGRSLQQQIEDEYLHTGGAAKLYRNINSMVISGEKKLTTADYLYLNQWANAVDNTSTGGIDSRGHKLRHITIRGAANAEIPANAFTGEGWRSITLIDATTIKTGAFVAGIGIDNLSFGSYDAITVESNAFGFDSENRVQLHISGTEYDLLPQPRGNQRDWKGLTWKAPSIKRYR